MRSFEVIILRQGTARGTKTEARLGFRLGERGTVIHRFDSTVLVLLRIFVTQPCGFQSGTPLMLLLPLTLTPPFGVPPVTVPAPTPIPPVGMLLLAGVPLV